MDFWIISLIILGLALLATLILVFVKMKRKKTEQVKEINYQAFFFLGICFVGTGTALTAAISPGFVGITGLGIVYMIIGLKDRDKWTNKKKET